MQLGLEEEGLYRIPGSTSKVNQLKAQFNARQPVDFEEAAADVHSVAGLLKLYFRELPEPLLTRELAPEFVAVACT